MAKTVGTLRADDGVQVGDTGTLLTKVIKGTVAVDLASLATTATADNSVTISGAAAGDVVILQPPATALTAGLLLAQAWVSAADTVKIRVHNPTGSTIDEASGTWTYILIKS